MQINITGHHVEVTQPLRDYVENKMQKIGLIFPKITNVHVILSVDKKFQQKAEARMNLSQKEVFAESEATDLYAAIDVLMDKLERQVIKHKELLKEGRGDNAGLV